MIPVMRGHLPARDHDVVDMAPAPYLIRIKGSRGANHRDQATSGITAALPAQDLGRARAFYVEKVGLQALESGRR